MKTEKKENLLKTQKIENWRKKTRISRLERTLTDWKVTGKCFKNLKKMRLSEKRTVNRREKEEKKRNNRLEKSEEMGKEENNRK